MYNKNNLAIHTCASTSGIRQGMTCVAFYGDKTIATDSYSLVQVSAKGEPHAPVLYPANIVKAVKLDKNAHIDAPYMGIQPLDDFYPEVDKVIKIALQNDKTLIKVNAEYLIKVLKAMKGVSKTVTIGIPTEPGRPMTIECAHDGQTATGLVMSIVK